MSSDSNFHVSTANMLTTLNQIIPKGLVPLVSSSPGMGKSSIAKEYAKEHNLFLIDIRLTTYDPADLNKVAIAA